jgi:hypothetical protein
MINNYQSLNNDDNNDNNSIFYDEEIYRISLNAINI